MATPYSIFDELTRLNHPSSPATDLIDFLLRSLAREACEDLRGAQTYFRIISRARDICDDINADIQKVIAEKDWEAYDRYTRAIDPLERQLFSIANIVQDETEALGGDYPPEIQEFLRVVNTWKSNRETSIRAITDLHTLDKFQSPDYDWESDTKAARIHDDLVWIGHMCNLIAAEIPDIVDAYRRSVPWKNAIRTITSMQSKLEDATSADHLTVELVSRCIMVFYGIISSSLKSEEEDYQVYLSSRKIWKEGTALLERIEEVIDASGPPDATLLQDWQIFEDSLLSPSDDIDELLERLIEYPAKIRRPYHAQSLALIKQCRTLGKHAKDNSGANTKIFRESVTIATLALDIGISVADKIERFEWSEIQEKDDAANKYAAAVTKIKECCAEYSVSAAEFETAWTAAQGSDEEVLSKLRSQIDSLDARGKSADVIDCACEEVADVKTAMWDHGTNVAGTDDSYDLKTGGDLNSILWRLGGSKGDRTLLATRPHFFERKNGAPDVKPYRYGAPKVLQTMKQFYIAGNKPGVPFASKLHETLENLGSNVGGSGTSTPMSEIFSESDL